LANFTVNKNVGNINYIVVGGGAGQNGNGFLNNEIGDGGSGIVVLWFAYP
jgi:hypothetical protein